VNKKSLVFSFFCLFAVGAQSAESSRSGFWGYSSMSEAGKAFGSLVSELYKDSSFAPLADLVFTATSCPDEHLAFFAALGGSARCPITMLEERFQADMRWSINFDDCALCLRKKHAINLLFFSLACVSWSIQHHSVEKGVALLALFENSDDLLSVLQLKHTSYGVCASRIATRAGETVLKKLLADEVIKVKGMIHVAQTVHAAMRHEENVFCCRLAAYERNKNDQAELSACVDAYEGAPLMVDKHLLDSFIVHPHNPGAGGARAGDAMAGDANPYAYLSDRLFGAVADSGKLAAIMDTMKAIRKQMSRAVLVGKFSAPTERWVLKMLLVIGFLQSCKEEASEEHITLDIRLLAEEALNELYVAVWDVHPLLKIDKADYSQSEQWGRVLSVLGENMALFKDCFGVVPGEIRLKTSMCSPTSIAQEMVRDNEGMEAISLLCVPDEPAAMSDAVELEHTFGMPAEQGMTAVTQHYSLTEMLRCCQGQAVLAQKVKICCKSMGCDFKPADIPVLNKNMRSIVDSECSLFEALRGSFEKFLEVCGCNLKADDGALHLASLAVFKIVADGLRMKQKTLKPAAAAALAQKRKQFLKACEQGNERATLDEARSLLSFFLTEAGVGAASNKLKKNAAVAYSLCCQLRAYMLKGLVSDVVTEASEAAVASPDSGAFSPATPVEMDVTDAKIAELQKKMAELTAQVPAGETEESTVHAESSMTDAEPTCKKRRRRKRIGHVVALETRGGGISAAVLPADEGQVEASTSTGDVAASCMMLASAQSEREYKSECKAFLYRELDCIFSREGGKALKKCTQELSELRAGVALSTLVTSLQPFLGTSVLFNGFPHKDEYTLVSLVDSFLSLLWRFGIENKTGAMGRLVPIIVFRRLAHFFSITNATWARINKWRLIQPQECLQKMVPTATEIKAAREKSKKNRRASFTVDNFLGLYFGKTLKDIENDEVIVGAVVNFCNQLRSYIDSANSGTC